MTKENTLPSEGQNYSVTQKFDTKRMIESEIGEADLPTALSELIDNSLDQTIPGSPCEVLITFDAREEKLIFVNKNTKGMKNEEFESLLQWGARHEGDRNYGEWGQGGKLAMLSMLDKAKGGMSITSQPAGSKIFYRLEIPQWWSKLTPQLAIQVVTSEADMADDKGFTRIELSGLKENLIPTALHGLADEIGRTYANLILEKKLNISLRKITKSGGAGIPLQVRPVEILFNRFNIHSQKDVSIDGGKIKFDIRYGMIDPDRTNKERADRASAYNLATPTLLKVEEGGQMLIRNKGRLHEVVPFSALKIPGLDPRRITFFHFVVDINVTAGVVPKTLLKKSLSTSSEERELIIIRARDIVRSYVADQIKGSESTVSEVNVKRVKEASVKFAIVVNNLFGNDPGKIMKEFFSSPEFSNIQYRGQGKTVEGRETHPSHSSNERTLSLPGIRGEKGSYEAENVIKVKGIKNPIPELRIEAYGGVMTPVAKLAVDTEGGKNVLFISFNNDNPEVKLALDPKSDLLHILKIAAQAMYHEKWITVARSDADIYRQGIEEDVARFLKKARQMK